MPDNQKAIASILAVWHAPCMLRAIRFIGLWAYLIIHQLVREYRLERRWAL